VSGAWSSTQGQQVIHPLSLPSIAPSEATGYSGCAGVKIQQQMALCLEQRAGMKGVDLF
jgi:hypothetical protein